MHGIIIVKQRILVDAQTYALPKWDEIKHHPQLADYLEQAITMSDGNFLVDLGAEQMDFEALVDVSLRDLLMVQSSDAFQPVMRAWQYALFVKTHAFCGQCGSRTRQIKWEMAKQCDSCGHRTYPRVSPCIIVAIRHGKQILLAQGARHTKDAIYSTLAGFVESGETLEQAVAREVMEEVGVRVKNIEYFGSQPWPFPHSLMVGFIAEYAGGEINVDGKEIIAAQWFDFADLPNIPSKVSIAGRLIEHTRQLVDGKA